MALEQPGMAHGQPMLVPLPAGWSWRCGDRCGYDPVGPRGRSPVPAGCPVAGGPVDRRSRYRLNGPSVSLAHPGSMGTTGAFGVFSAQFGSAVRGTKGRRPIPRGLDQPGASSGRSLGRGAKEQAVRG